MRAPPKSEPNHTEHVDAVVDFLRIIIQPGGVFELRCLDVERGNRADTISGYFDTEHIQRAAAYAMAASGKSTGCYVTVNELNPEVLDRRPNEAKWATKRCPSTTDADVVRRRILPFDIDPVRTTGVAATDEQQAHALELCHEIRTYLADEHWPEPLIVNSGNGYYLLYSVDLPADDGGLVKRILQNIAQEFNTDLVKVDCSVHNPSRILRIPGSMNCKGAGSAKRPHRRAAIVRKPNAWVPVSQEALEAVGGTGARQESPRDNGQFSIDDWLEVSGLQFKPAAAWQGGRRWVLETCPFDESHSRGEAVILQHASGALSFKCQHDSCGGYKWADLRARVDAQNGAFFKGAAHNPDFSREKLSYVAQTPVEDENYSPLWTPFPIDVLPPSLAEFTLCASKSLGVDPSVVVLPMLVTAAGALGPRVRAMVKGGWDEPAILWGAIIGHSGDTKTQALKMAKTFPISLEMKSQAEYVKEMKGYKIAEREYRKAFKEWDKNPDGEEPEEPTHPQRRRYYIDDVTIESVAAVLDASPTPLMVSKDELSGWLWSFNQYSSGKADVPRWLELYNGGTLTVDRKTSSPIFVHNAGVSICGGIQTDMLNALLSGENKALGLAQRFLLAYPPDIRRRYTDYVVPAHVRAGMFSQMDRIYEISCSLEKSRELFLPITNEAREIWKPHSEAVNDRHFDLKGPLYGTFRKLEGGAIRLALIDAMLRCNPDEPIPTSIGVESMAAGVRIAWWFGLEAERVFYIAQHGVPAVRRNSLSDWIRDRDGEVTARTLNAYHRGFKGKGGSTRATDALQDLVNHGFGKWEVTVPGPKGGRPTDKFILTQCLRYET